MNCRRVVSEVADIAIAIPQARDSNSQTRELRTMRYELTTSGLPLPMLPNKPRCSKGERPRVLNGIFCIAVRARRDLPESFGPYTLLQSLRSLAAGRRLARDRRALLSPMTQVQMIDTSIAVCISTAPASLGTEDSRWAGHEAG
jgi:hypothetical protein